MLPPIANPLALPRVSPALLGLGTVILSLSVLVGCGQGVAGVGSSPPTPREISVTIEPTSAAVNLGQSQAFIATVSGADNKAVTWSVNDVPGGNADLGTITPASGDSPGLYSAPARLPNPPTVNVTATSQADPSRRASAQVTITSQVAVSLAPTSTRLPVSGTQLFVASVSGSPDTAVRWFVNGIAGGNATVGTIAADGAYIAPAIVPSPPTIIVEAISLADPSKRAAAQVTIHVRISILPLAVLLSPGATQAFTASVEGTSNSSVTWNVNGIVGGDAAVGTITSAGLYTAPDNPTLASVEVAATSQFDLTPSASATVTFTLGVAVTLSPTNPLVVFGASQAFTATVLGSPDTRVEWSVNDQVGGNDVTGTISPSGVYQAPVMPAMDSLEVQARSLADPTKSARTTVHLFGLRGLRPRALSAGALGPITLAASGANLDLATAILISSSARAATFSGDALRTTLAPNDLAQPGTLAVSAATASGSISNTLPLVVAPLRTIPATVAISAAAPSLTAQDIIVTDDSGLGLASPVKLNLLLLSLLRAGNCDDLARRPLRLQRPALDSATFGVCLAADGIGADFSGLQISLTGPADVTIANIRTAATGSAAILVVDLVLTASTAGGARSLVLQNPNHDVSAAFGAIVIE